MLDPISYLRRAARTIAVLAVAAMVFVWAVPAGAQDPTAAQYKDRLSQIVGSADGGSGGDGSTAGSDAPPGGLQKEIVGSLPFTGLDAIALVAVAFALTSMGIALRRLTPGQNRPDQSGA